MESMATLCIAAHGYGIRYDHGMFRQVIQDGWQQEYPGELADLRQSVGSRTPGRHPSDRLWRHCRDKAGGRRRPSAMSGTRPKPSMQSPTIRRWSAGADTMSTRCGSGPRGPPNPLRLDAFNRGDHVGALAARARANAISQVLYPSDESPAGQELRLRQEYFFTSASLQDLVGRHMRQHNGDIRTLPDKAAIQLNDTHPAIAVAELMRILVDLHEIPWEEAWQITTGHDLLHQPHAAARGAGELAGVADGAAAAAPHADRLPDQPRCISMRSAPRRVATARRSPRFR